MSPYVTNAELKDELRYMESRFNDKFKSLGTTIRWGIGIAILVIPSLVGIGYAAAQNGVPT